MAADINAQLLDTARLLVTGAGNSVGHIFGATGALSYTDILTLTGITGPFGPYDFIPPGPTGGRGPGPFDPYDFIPPGPTGGRGPIGITGGTLPGPGTLTVPSNVLGGRPGLFSRMSSKLGNIRRTLAHAISVPQAGSSALTLTSTNGIHLPFDQRFQEGILNPPTPHEGSIVGLFMLWQNKILIQKRVAEPATISCPSGLLEGGETFEEAAVRELNEESQFDPAPDTDTLTLFHRTQTPDASGNLVDVAFYYCLVDATATVTTSGPVTDDGSEVDTTYDFSDVSGAEIRDEHSGHAWISPENLEQYVKTMVEQNKLFADAVDKFMEIQDEAFGRTVEEIDMNAPIPAWASDYFSIDDIPDNCSAATIIGPDCLAKAVQREIMAAEQFKKSLRLRKKPDAALKKYNEKAAELAVLRSLPSQSLSEEQVSRLGELEKELESEYPERLVHVRSSSDNRIHTMTVPNPYRALAYREDRKKPVNFADPVGYGGSDKDPHKLMYNKNLQLLSELAPPTMIADSAMAISLLESLWFCGSNPTLSNDPRCYPARVLGELREWDANKKQTEAGRRAQDALDGDSSWGVTKQLMAALENGLAGSTVYPFIEVRTGVKPKVTAVGPVGAGTTGATGPADPVDSGATGATGPIIIVSGATGATGPKPLMILPPLSLGGPIIPLSLGGGGAFMPLIPITLGRGSP